MDRFWQGRTNFGSPGGHFCCQNQSGGTIAAKIAPLGPVLGGTDFAVWLWLLLSPLQSCSDLKRASLSTLVSSLCVSASYNYCILRHAPTPTCTHTHTDDNECRDGTDECGDYSTCLNTLGTYLCRCNKGFKRGSSRFECEGEDHQYIHAQLLLISHALQTK